MLHWFYSRFDCTFGCYISSIADLTVPLSVTLVVEQFDCTFECYIGYMAGLTVPLCVTLVVEQV